jgi:quercetin dioxygenase-like cupin family protein
MDRKAIVLHNPVTGEWARELVSAEESGGARIVGELLAQPRVRPPGAHRHPAQTETFEVLTGRLTFRVEGTESIAGPGEAVAVPPNALHDWWNAGDAPSLVRVTMAPAGRFGDGLAAVWGLAALGRTNRLGRMGLIDAALYLEAFGSDIVFENPPPWVQRLMASIVAPLARAFGRRVDDERVLSAAAMPADRWPG